MKRFFTRHMSLRRRAHYTLLSCSDSQLNRTLKNDTKGDICGSPEDVDTAQNVSQPRRRWYKLSRRKKRRESETTLVRDEEGAMLSSQAHEDLEIAVEASPCHYEDTYTGHATLTRSVSASMLDVRNAGIDGEHCAQVNRTVIPVHEHFVQMHTANRSGLKPEHLGKRRFAICEELERDIIMDNGVNLRKSRKNLVIRQVLHDLLLL
ncbi:Hypothetical predicted protein [Paramuricea clavata]|uniref:Uncharacterized protein n=1 Tax=Paramuricea clavata TaxID=317549 RepID=A0A7D9E2B1_PARCT|nr:Hypothetical predicted protein [Paramuricea clavata]